MFKKMKIQPKLVIMGCLLVILPQLIIASITFVQNKVLLDDTLTETKKLAYADLDHIVKSVYSLVQSHQDVNDLNIKSALNVAREVVTTNGGFTFDDKTVRWEAVNQFSLAPTPIDLPMMKVGNTWLGQVANPKANVLVVDRVRDLVSTTCTIFQRMNPAGDMLRVATNVIKKDGTRAIGTYIPAVEPDGNPNPVVAKILKGESFVGKAYVVNARYITAYEPIRDAANKIVGMLYVGIPLESVTSLRQSIMSTIVGKTGYAWVLDSQGNYIISQHGKRDGENINDLKDEKGSLFIQEMIKKAKALKPGQIAEHHYPWKNPGETQTRMKVARLTYFEPWDWVIGAGSAEEEFLDSTTKLEAAGMRSTILLLVVLVLSLTIAVVVWTLVARQITKPIVTLIDATERMSRGEIDIKIEVDSKDEIGSLAEAITRMQTSLKLAMTRMRKKS
ncbi:MAG: Cache 3/Cache 2 fusion domain-containing protein [Desulforhopalus sp.]|nr:Cache 3/Cache 2 fusion domain-containing protein [Desulforhopalus sp.]